MTVVAAYLYRHGKRVREVAIDEKVDCAQDKSEFVWIGIANPTAEELRTLQAHYDLHPLAVEDALKADQLPKVDVYGDQLFVVARTAHLEGERDRLWRDRDLRRPQPHHHASATSRRAPTARCATSSRRRPPC